MHPKIPGFIALIISSFDTSLTEDICQPITDTNDVLRITTMEEEPAIITELYRAAAEHDLDIMEYTMHSRMIQDEDDNFITTLTFQFIQIDN